MNFARIGFLCTCNYHYQLADKYFICALKAVANKGHGVWASGILCFSSVYTNQANMKTSILFCPICIYVPSSLCVKPLQSEWFL